MPQGRNERRSKIREREAATLKVLRARHAEKFWLAERILDFGVQLVDGQRIQHSSGDVLTGRVLISLYVKMLAIFWAIVALAERGLPASSLMRELVEALISTAYIAKEDSVTRAELYRDYLPIRHLKNLNRRLNDPDSRDTVTPESQQAVEAVVAGVVVRRGEDSVGQMKKWQTWAGSFGLETMARRAGLPGTVYNLPYSVESRAVHSLDAADYLTIDENEILRAQMPDRLEQHLIPACMTLLVAMDTIRTQFGLTGEEQLRSLLAEVERLNEERREKREDA